jgi:hypothetical protein
MTTALNQRKHAISNNSNVSHMINQRKTTHESWHPQKARPCEPDSFGPVSVFGLQSSVVQTGSSEWLEHVKKNESTTRDPFHIFFCVNHPWPNGRTSMPHNDVCHDLQLSIEPPSFH